MDFGVSLIKGREHPPAHTIHVSQYDQVGGMVCHSEPGTQWPYMFVLAHLHLCLRCKAVLGLVC